MSLVRFRSLASFAVPTVPCAILVHVTAEALALGSNDDGDAFLARHAYLAVLFIATICWFGASVGVGRSHAEMTRRCALARTHLREISGRTALPMFFGVNLAFFGLTQLFEGVPIAGGSAIALGLTAAIAGSLISAFVIFFWGRSIVAAAIGSIAAPRRDRAPLDQPAYLADLFPVPRSAAAAYSLFIPTRPPPTRSVTSFAR